MKKAILTVVFLAIIISLSINYRAMKATRIVIQAMKQETLEEADKKFLEAIDYFPNRNIVLAYFNYMVSLAGKINNNSYVKTLTSSIDELEKYTEKDKYNAMIYERLAIGYQIKMAYTKNEDDYKKALLNINKAIDLSKEHISYYQIKASIYSSTGDTEKAMEAIKEAVALLPAYKPLYKNIAQIYEQRGDKEKALRFLELSR